MSGNDAEEWQAVEAAAATRGPRDAVRHEWQSAFGLVVIEVRDGRVYVDGDLVEPATSTQSTNPGA